MTPDGAASPYSTGGGGVVLEHRYAATLLARLLVGAPCSEIGDRIQLTRVRLQASDVSAVDDIVLEGTASDGTVHRASIGVRRDPALNSSDTASVPLIRAYLKVVTGRWDEVSAGRWSLVLAVAASRPAFSQVETLAVIARSVADAASFDAAVNRPRATNALTRRRLGHLKNLVVAAAADESELAEFTADELAWRFLSSLSIRSLRLEGTDTSDRSSAVAVLQGVVADGSLTTADNVLNRLAELADDYAPTGAQVTGAMLRRRLSSYPVKAFGPHERAWTTFGRLGDLLQQQTKSTLSAGHDSVHIPRTEARDALRRSMEACAEVGGSLVVTGEPDVGKSALAVEVGAALRADGAFVTCMSLRDVRGTILEFEGQLGGATLADLFAGAPTAEVRLLVVDGCEAVLEGQESLFAELAASAIRQSIGVAAVTRSDGQKFVEAVLQRVTTATESMPAVQTHIVEELGQAEREILAERIPGLTRVIEDSKSNWLLGRLGLVDALLRSGRPIEPEQLLCEADVYIAVWNGLVLRNGTHPPGLAPPEEREGATLAVARRRLGSQEPPPATRAVRELRSEGVFRSDANPAVSKGPDFSTDLYRDFSLCRLFLSAGWGLLSESAAPRWTTRAVRLACQVRLANRDRTRRQVWEDLTNEFSAIAASEGVRWTEVPIEALLTVGDAREAIADLWDVLQGGGGLETLLRIAAARYGGVFGDRFALAPIVEVAFCEARDVGRSRAGMRDSPQERVQELVLAWLRGMAHANSGPDPLRQRVRETILGQDRPLYDEFAVQALASLGEDLNDAAASWLRTVASERPDALHEIPESPATVLALASIDPELLLELTEAYYIEQPEPDDAEFGWAGSRGRRHLDDGIRDFQHGNAFGFGPPSAAWYYGPFFRLLNQTPLKTIAFINRMLNQAAFYRVTDDTQILTSDVDWSDYPGASLHLTDKSGLRHYVGDAHVWSWYRGSTVGPYACMSALLALERFIDSLHKDAEIPLGTIVDLLLDDCHNLAIPGMLHGFLTRHLDEAGDLLDPFLADVTVWHLETGRVTTEGAFTVRDRDADNLVGQDKRRYSPHDTVGWMVVNARAADNQERLVQLEAVGSRLLQSAQRNVDAELTASVDPDPAEAALTREGPEQYLAMVGSWAAEFRADNYKASVVDGGVVVQFERPAELEAVLAPGNAHIMATQAFMRLQVAYALKNETPQAWPTDSITADIAEARRLMDESSSAMLDRHENPVVAVAAAGLRAHALGFALLEPTDLDWAVELVLTAAEEPWIDGFSTASSLFSMGADRAAATAVPLLLLPAFDGLNIDVERLQRALISLATSVYDEVRTSFAKGMTPVWASECAASEGGVCARHEPLWQAVQACIATVRLGPWEYETQRRQHVVVEGPFEKTLPAVPSDELLVNRLRMPVVCNHAALATQCTAARAELLAGPLWDAHLRGLDHAWRGNYDHLGERHHELVARLFIELAADGDREALDKHLRMFAANAHALHSFLHSFATVFSYDDQLRPLLAEFWPPAMVTVLDEFDAGTSLIDDSASWYDYAISALLPVPQIRSEDLDPDATLANCRDSWAPPQAFSDGQVRWGGVRG